MITFQDKVSLNTDPSIADINKIKDSDINALKAGINTNETNINNIKSAMAYSTTEVKTNKVWIDGKPIYKIVYSVGSMSANTSKTIDTSTWNLDTMTYLDGFGVGNAGFHIPLNFYNGGNYNVIYALPNKNINIEVDWAMTNVYAIIEYTKTTDVAP